MSVAESVCTCARCTLSPAGPIHTIEWIDDHREPQCAPDPAFPEGRDLDIRLGALGPSCSIRLPYPAPRCGFYVVTCSLCAVRDAITTAGRPDDPRSVRMPCNLLA